MPDKAAWYSISGRGEAKEVNDTMDQETVVVWEDIPDQMDED